MYFHFFLYCTNGHFLLLFVLRHAIQKTKKHILHKWGVRLHCVLLRKIIYVYWINSDWFDFIHYAEIIFLSKNVIFLYILKRFFYILKIFFAMLHLKIFLKYWIIMYIFRISLCITSLLQRAKSLKRRMYSRSFSMWAAAF